MYTVFLSGTAFVLLVVWRIRENWNSRKFGETCFGALLNLTGTGVFLDGQTFLTSVERIVS